MIASLPMYDRPETAGANDRFWRAIASALRDRGVAAPAALDRKRDLWDTWLSPDLVLSQTCGFPYRARLHGKVTLVATPVLDLPGVPPGHYYSALVARRGGARRAFADFDGAALAYNDPMSQSGWAAPEAHARAAGIAFGRFLETGSHRASARAVAERSAAAARPCSRGAVDRGACVLEKLGCATHFQISKIPLSGDFQNLKMGGAPPPPGELEGS